MIDIIETINSIFILLGLTALLLFVLFIAFTFDD